MWSAVSEARLSEALCDEEVRLDLGHRESRPVIDPRKDGPVRASNRTCSGEYGGTARAALVSTSDKNLILIRPGAREVHVEVSVVLLGRRIRYGQEFRTG